MLLLITSTKSTVTYKMNARKKNHKIKKNLFTRADTKIVFLKRVNHKFDLDKLRLLLKCLMIHFLLTYLGKYSEIIGGRYDEAVLKKSTLRVKQKKFLWKIDHSINFFS